MRLFGCILLFVAILLYAALSAHCSKQADSQPILVAEKAPSLDSTNTMFHIDPLLRQYSYTNLVGTQIWAANAPRVRLLYSLGGCYSCRYSICGR